MQDFEVTWRASIAPAVFLRCSHSWCKLAPDSGDLGCAGHRQILPDVDDHTGRPFSLRDGKAYKDSSIQNGSPGAGAQRVKSLNSQQFCPDAGRRGAQRSGIKEEPEGRGTAAELSAAPA